MQSEIKKIKWRTLTAIKHQKLYNISNHIKDLFQNSYNEPFNVSHRSTVHVCVGNYPPQNGFFMQSGIKKYEIENSDCKGGLETPQYIQPYERLV